jgi:hypothetical protein
MRPLFISVVERNARAEAFILLALSCRTLREIAFIQIIQGTRV